MKVYTPKYYNEFKCIADKCPHSCCIGWEKYRALQSSYSRDIMSSIEEGDEPRFRMCRDGRCPHLDSDGLCKIILTSGEEYLSDICREHPRFYNRSSRGIEMGIGMACEEAARIILESDFYLEFSATEEIEDNGEEVEFDAIAKVEKIFTMLSDSYADYTVRLGAIYKEYRISPGRLSDSEWRSLLSGLEYLDQTQKQRFSVYSSRLDSLGNLDKILERALAYFVYRHCSGATDEGDFLTSLGFALFLERLFASIIKEEEIQERPELVRLARIISEELEYSEDNTDSIRLEFCF